MVVSEYLLQKLIIAGIPAVMLDCILSSEWLPFVKDWSRKYVCMADMANVHVFSTGGKRVLCNNALLSIVLKLSRDIILEVMLLGRFRNNESMQLAQGISADPKNSGGSTANV